MISIRRATPDDADALYRISLVTGDGGRDAGSLHSLPTLVGDLYSVPHLHLEPTLAFVAEEAAEVLGFAVGAADTRGFERAMAEVWLPRCRARLPAPDAPGLTDEDRRRLHQIVTPVPTPEAVVAQHPAHMHMNLDAKARGQGVGRRLFDTFLAALPPLTPSGLHIGSRADNAGGIAFWQAVGFRALDIPGDRTHWMGRRAQG